MKILKGIASGIFSLGLLISTTLDILTTTQLSAQAETLICNNIRCVRAVRVRRNAHNRSYNPSRSYRNSSRYRQIRVRRHRHNSSYYSPNPYRTSSRYGRSRVSRRTYDSSYYPPNPYRTGSRYGRLRVTRRY